MQCPNEDPSRLRQPIVLPFRPVREGIREISVYRRDSFTKAAAAVELLRGLQFHENDHFLPNPG